MSTLMKAAQSIGGGGYIGGAGGGGSGTLGVLSSTTPWPQNKTVTLAQGCDVDEIIDDRFPYADHTGPDFSLDGPVYATSFSPALGKNAFHLRVWHRIHGEDCKDQGFVSGFPSILPCLAFGSQKSRNAFQKWLTGYKTRYGDGDLSLRRVPLLPTGRFTGEVVETEDAVDVEEWAWIVTTAGNVWFSGGQIFFEDTRDAVAFKLRFG